MNYVIGAPTDADPQTSHRHCRIMEPRSKGVSPRVLATALLEDAYLGAGGHAASVSSAHLWFGMISRHQLSTIGARVKIGLLVGITAEMFCPLCGDSE